MVMNATFNCRLTVSRSPIAYKAVGFNSPISRGVCQFNGAASGHHALKANLEDLERQYLTLVEFVILFFCHYPPSAQRQSPQYQPVLHRVEAPVRST